jgi:hypothetical protein
MPPTCTACRHVDRLEIDKSLAAGIPFRTVADRFDLSSTALYRHRTDGHLADIALVEQHAHELERVEAIHGQATDLFIRGKKLLVMAEQADNHGTVLKAMRECVRVLDLLQRLVPPAPVTAQLDDQKLRIGAAINSTVDEFFADDVDASKRFREILSARFDREGL